MHKERLNYFKKKKNIAIIVLSFSFTVLIAFLLIYYFKKLYLNEFFTTIVLLLLIAYVILLVYFRSKIILFNMNFNYFKMVVNDKGAVNSRRKLYTSSWLNKFTEDDFKKGFENNNFIIMFKFFKKIPNLGKTGHTLIAFVIGKNENFDLFDAKVGEEIENLFMTYEYESRVRKQIIIQFKKYETLNDDYIEELREIINFKNGEQVLINLNVGYFVKENKIYYLTSNDNKFYNKYHFYANELIEKYTFLSGEKNE